MDEIREKLTELINDVLSYLPWGEISSCTAYECADHLMANGVTVADGKDTDVPDNNVGNKWIPVTERLPEHFEAVLLWESNEEDVYTGELDGNDEWFIAGFPFENFTFTHWMHLPEPPKGE